MARIISLLISVYWTAYFALQAGAHLNGIHVAGFRVSAGGKAAAWQLPLDLSLCLLAGLVSTLFLWLFANLLSDGVRSQANWQIARLAFAGALGVSIIGLLVPNATGTGGMALAALIACYMAFQIEALLDDGEADSAHEGEGQGVARLVALGAARDSILLRTAIPKDYWPKGGDN
ncbi:hypothetical protein [Nitratireductor thuwali]|uniref:Transmembrane protein n=1 Tax=Nitratireductor thuwali TaxID=2267699 RepID=A0ABY5MF49_9HYPH|nr:hypothetical protein NTH_00265 [Nitratireductor thuwali]